MVRISQCEGIGQLRFVNEDAIEGHTGVEDKMQFSRVVQSCWQDNLIGQEDEVNGCPGFRGRTIKTSAPGKLDTMLPGMNRASKRLI